MNKSKKMPVLRLKAGREKALLRKHPWIFSGAISSVDGVPEGGDTVLVRTADDQILGFGAYSPQSQIRCRMWEFSDQALENPDLAVENLLAERINSAIQRRVQDSFLQGTNAYRLVHAESDHLPGLIIDQYNDILVAQFLSAGVEKYRDQIIHHIPKVVNPKAIFERSDADVRSLEGLEPRTGFMWNEGEPDTIIRENDLRYKVDFMKGHKTGFYLDQRENRKLLQKFCLGKEVLDCFCYTGGFSLNAIMGGAKSVTAVDTAEDALSSLQTNLELNDLGSSKVEMIQNDVFKQLRLFRDQRRTFDVIILDPPKFAPTRKHAQRAARGYKDINLLAAKLLNPGGILFTFSCSGGIDPTLFQQIVAGAALDADVILQIIGKMEQASDHPVLLSFPEGEYLKGLICRRIM